MPTMPEKSPLLGLPNELLRLVLSRLGTRALLCAGATCRTLRTAVADMPLRPVLTPRTDIVVTNIVDWMTSSGVAPRVVSLTARCCAWGNAPFLTHLNSLKTLVIAFGMVRDTMLRWLPTSLEHLDIHRIQSYNVGVFHTSKFAHLTNLHVLKVTFTRSWHTVVIDSEMGKLPLRHLCLRGRQTFVGPRAPLHIRTVHLDSYCLAGWFAPVHASDLRLLSDTTIDSLDKIITPATARHLHALHLKCVGVTDVPFAQHMHTTLRHLHLNFDRVKLDMATVPLLSSMVLETKCGAALSSLVFLPTRTAVYVGGVPVLHW